MILLGVLYDEVDPSTYEGIELKFSGPEFEPEHQEVFNTGNPTHDYLTAMFALQELYGEAAEHLVRHRSSYNHFAFDGGDLPEDGFTDEQILKARWAALVFLVEKFVKQEEAGGPQVKVETSDQVTLNLIRILVDRLSPDGLQRLARGVQKEALAAQEDTDETD